MKGIESTLRAGAAATLVLACAACHRPAPGAHSARGAEASLPPLGERDVAEIVERVSGARQLPVTRAVRVHQVDRPTFLARLRAGSHDDSDHDGERDRAFLLGFDFVPEPSARARLAGVDEVLEDEVAGFYDKKRDEVFVPGTRVANAKERLVQRAVLAHEVQHALQAQHFPEPEEPATGDEALARLALIEGDAQAAMGAFLGAEGGEPVGRSLRRLREMTERVPLSAIPRDDKPLDRALAVVRERLLFPYQDGMAFVSDLYRAGGFELVDAAYRRPPRATEHILHPQKYLAGEAPRPFRPLAAPKGLRVVTHDALGELQIRVLLARCMPAADAERAAAGWGGDAFTVLADGQGHLVVAWSTAWDSEADAREAEQALQRSQACWTDNELEGLRVGKNFALSRKGSVVGFVRGADDAAARALLATLVGLAGPAPAATPVSDRTIPPRVALPEPSPGRLTGDVYRNDWLGLVARVPPGMRARVATEGMDLVIDRPDQGVAGAIAVSTRIASDAQNERTFREVHDDFARSIDELGLSVAPLGGGPVTTALGPGVSRSWGVPGTALTFELVLVPICAGTGSVVLVGMHADPHGRVVVEGWLASLRWTAGRSLVACDYLDPK